MTSKKKENFMSKINAAKLADATRTATAALTFEDEGVRQTDNFKVEYRALSPRMMRELSDTVVDENDRVDIVKYLLKVVRSMPEVVGEDGQPIILTEGFFDTMDSSNLKSIFKAIQDDVSPNEKPLGS
jgi:hypothetical protein